MNKEEVVAKLLPVLEGKGPGDIISIASQELGDRLMMTTAFGYSGIVLLSFVKDVAPNLPIYFIDTGFHFEETLKLRLKIMAEWNINIQRLASTRFKKDLDEILGREAYRTNPDLCCYHRKVEPLLNLMKEDTVWLSATRRDQSPTRVGTSVIEIDGRGQIKISPLFNWTSDDCWTYIRKYDLPYNPLHDQYYPSIGCYPCTNPVDEGGTERSGRWTGIDKIECGLHVPLNPDSSND
ncbi:MAG: phosphoadenylyl-sulfate reductase [Candidatus Marinimicrobia bacterium]|nr:phosphoadenylyl-sulfate reductase [Candidatus Neomarinimicrobiota bacterium]